MKVVTRFDDNVGIVATKTGFVLIIDGEMFGVFSWSDKQAVLDVFGRVRNE